MSKKVVIVGGGFGGLAAAKTLADHTQFQVLLIDRRNHHLFQPLLYQVATAGLNPADIAIPIRGEFSNVPNVQVQLGGVERVSLKDNLVYGAGFAASFDYLILACGAQHSYFGKDEWEEFAPGLKTLEQATEIRRRVLSAFELAENEENRERQKALLTFVVVGGGPTGLELAGALADISRTVLVNDFKKIDPSKTKIILIEAGPRILSMFSQGLSSRATQDLKDLGVEVRNGSRVTAIDAEGVSIGSERIQARTVIWAAGVQASALGKSLGVELDSAGRVLVESDLSLLAFRNVFVIGDQSHVSLPGNRSLPGLAPVAIQQGKHAAKQIIADSVGRARKPFVYRDKGMMATVGRRRAVMEVGQLKIGGFSAWIGWLVVHLFFLVGFKNRVAVLALWAWSYIFHKRGSRLITNPNWRS